MNKKQSDLFTTFMIRQYESRVSKNPSYSIRAYAKYLGVDQSQLTKIINRKISVSCKFIQKTIDKLELKSKERKILLKNSDEEVKYALIENDKTDFISSWFYPAILELFELEDFVFNIQNVSDKLGLRLSVAKDAIIRLERMGIIKFEQGNYQPIQQSHSWYDKTYTNKVKKKYQKEVLKKAMDAIEDYDFHERDNGSLTIAVNKANLNELREEFRNFRKTIDKYCQSKGDQNEVYQLVTAFFPLKG